MSRGRRIALGVGAGALLAVAAGLAWRWWQPATPPRQSVPSEFWTQRYPKPDGGELAIADFRGRPLVINFWATWCAPCVRELPEIDRFARDHAAESVQVIALAIDGKTPVLEFMQQTKLGLPVGLAGFEGTEVARLLGNDRAALPYTVMIDAAGELTHRRLGETSYRELSGWIRAK